MPPDTKRISDFIFAMQRAKKSNTLGAKLGGLAYAFLLYAEFTYSDNVTYHMGGIQLTLFV